jgi:glycosyl transferase family 2
VQEVTVIIPTQALAARSAVIQRAIDSVLVQQGVRAVPLLSINGTRGDPELLARLRADRRLTLVEQENAGIPGAFELARATVTTPFLSALDDDDLLLPGALSARVQLLREHPECDSVITNGFRRAGTRDQLHVADSTAVNRDPLAELLLGNWLLPGSWLCRSEAADAAFFAAMPRFRECTYLAVRFGMSGRMIFLDLPTVVWHTGTPGTESGSRQYRVGGVEATNRLLELPLPAKFREGLRRKLSAACHVVAEIHLLEGAIGEAWKWHFRSLRYPGGLRHVFYTRRLLAATVRS